jgi:hypothetical protein
LKIIVDEQDWIPGVTFLVDKTGPVKIGFEKIDLREQMKRAGGY